MLCSRLRDGFEIRSRCALIFFWTSGAKIQRKSIGFSKWHQCWNATFCKTLIYSTLAFFLAVSKLRLQINNAKIQRKTVGCSKLDYFEIQNSLIAYLQRDLGDFVPPIDDRWQMTVNLNPPKICFLTPYNIYNYNYIYYKTTKISFF